MNQVDLAFFRIEALLVSLPCKLPERTESQIAVRKELVYVLGLEIAIYAGSA